MANKKLSLNEHMARISVLGGKALLKSRGREHYIKMAKIRWAKYKKSK